MEQTKQLASEDAAWERLANTLDREPDDTQELVSFGDWANLDVYLDSGQGSLDAHAMRALVSYQESVWRSYAIIRYGSSDLNRMRDDEFQALMLELVISNPGSTGVLANTANALSAMAEAAHKMNGEQWRTVLISFGLMAFGTTCFSLYLDNRAETLRMSSASQERIAMIDAEVKRSKQETARMQILQRAYHKVPELQDVDQQIGNGRNDLLKGFSNVSRFNFQGKTLTGGVARELSRNPSRVPREETVRTMFRILNVNAQVADGFRVQLEDTSTGEKLTASLKASEASDALREKIKNAEWSKKPIELNVFVRRLGGAVQSADLMDEPSSGWSTTTVKSS